MIILYQIDIKPYITQNILERISNEYDKDI